MHTSHPVHPSNPNNVINRSLSSNSHTNEDQQSYHSPYITEDHYVDFDYATRNASVVGDFVFALIVILIVVVWVKIKFKEYKRNGKL